MVKSELLMVKAGLYRVYQDSSLLCTIKRISVEVHKPWGWERRWLVDSEPTHKGYHSLSKAIQSLNLEFQNYPGPLKLIEKSKKSQTAFSF